MYEGDAGGGDDRWSVDSDYRSGYMADVLPGFGVIDGGEGDDELIGGATLRGGPGDDVLLATFENTVLDGGPGADVLDGGRFRTVDCGRAASVRIDSRDLAQGCRRLERTGTPRPRIEEVGTTANYNPGAINGGEFGRLTIRCSDDQEDGCGSLVRVYALGREVGRTRVSAPAGRDTRVLFRLRPSFRREVDERFEVDAVYRVDTRDARGRPIALRARQTFCDYANAFC